MNQVSNTGPLRRVLPVVEIALLVLALPLPWVLDDFWVVFATKMIILALLAISFDLVWGYAGIMSFGQALFFGVAGYTAALLATKSEVTSIFILLPLSGLVGLVLAFIVAAIVIFGKRIPVGGVRRARHDDRLLRRRATRPWLVLGSVARTASRRSRGSPPAHSRSRKASSSSTWPSRSS